MYSSFQPVESGQPFYGSVRYMKNKPSCDPFELISMYDIFMSKDNLIRQLQNIKSLYYAECEEQGLDEFLKYVPKYMKTFAERANLRNPDSYKLSQECGGKQDVLNRFRAVNRDFIRYVTTLIPANRYIPQRQYAQVGAINEYEDNSKKVKMLNMMAEDFKSLDVWRQTEVQTHGYSYRYKNEIPPWQTSLHARHYDRSNEGLHANEPDRASLQAPPRGFNMRDIYLGMENYNMPEWYSMH